MQNIKNIVIVGGGTSGWSTAAYISNQLPNCKVTIIDQEGGMPIGVGEATILTFKTFMEGCGFNYWDWLNNIDATPKAGIVYPGWVRKDNTVWHPFNTSKTVVNSMRQYEMWTHNRDLDFKKYAISSYQTVVEHNTPSSSQAFHIDCIKFIKYVKERILGDIIYINKGVKTIHREGDKILKLELQDGNIVTADLFVDCSGFKNILTINPVKKDLYGRLFCNTAQSCHVEYNNRAKELHPYTKAVATDIGWIWVIPTRTRIGSGIVYDKNCVSDEQAKKCLQDFWKDHTMSDTHKHNWDPYYKEKIWESNVVSVGLSAGFIEPLESTGLALIHLGITRLVDKIKHYSFTDTDISHYNLEMTTAFEDAIDFVSMHYSKTERTEPFWQYVSENYKLTDRLKQIIEAHLNSDTLQISGIYENIKIFSPLNYTLWLEQLGYHKKVPITLRSGLDNTQIRAYLCAFSEIVEGTAHYNYKDAHTEVAMYEKYWGSPFKPLGFE